MGPALRRVSEQPSIRQRRQLAAHLSVAYMISMESGKTEPPKLRRGCPPGAGTTTPAHGGRIGQPAYKPTAEDRANVRAWVKITNADTIAAKLGISRDTLDKYFKDELAEGRFEAVAAVGGKLLEKALRGDKTSMIFYLRTQGKWNTRIEHTGLNGGPITMFDASAFLAEMSVEEQRLMRPLLEKMLAAAGIDPDGDDATDPAG